MSDSTALVPVDADAPEEISKAIEAARKAVGERLASINLKQHYGEAIDLLDDNFAFFLTHVLNMGRPEWDSSIRTAAVYIPAKSAGLSDFKYIFSPTFAAMLTPEEFAFIMAHETMHILLNHLSLLKNGQARGKFKDRERFNIACDVVINDYLTSMGLEPGRLATIQSKGMFGPDVVGYNCSNSTVSEVYLDVPENYQGEPGEDGDENDPLDQYLKGTGQGQATGSHGWMDDTGQGQGDTIDGIGDDATKNGGTPQDIQDKKDDDDRKGSMGAPPGSEAGRMQKFVEQKGVSMKWAELLRQVDPDFFNAGGPLPRPSYHKPRRKIAGVMEEYPDMGTLPIQRDPDNPRGETPCIVMFMDGSGSCAHYINTFCTLAKSVPPKKLKLIAYTFSTYVTPFDVQKDDNSVASGGTEFSIIEDKIQQEVVPMLGHYPRAVVVLTDGIAYFSGNKPEQKYRDRWLWLLTDNMRYGSQYPRDSIGSDQSIDKFCEGMSGISKPGQGYY